MMLSLSYFVVLIWMTSSSNADYSMNIELTAERVNEGGSVVATCDVTAQQSASFNVIWVKRTIDGNEVDIGSHGNMSDKFKRTNRYLTGKQQSHDSHFLFTLTINGLTSGDSGEIGCSIPSHRIKIYKPFTVVVPVRSVTMRSRALDKSHAAAYHNNQNVSFPDGAVREFTCDVTGSFPQPDVSIFIGDRNMTSDFNRTGKLVYTEPDSMRGIQSMHYNVELHHPNLHIGSEFGGKTLRCIASVPQSTISPVNSSIYVNFLSYRPKFIGCSNHEIVMATLDQRDVRFECDIQAVPAVNELTVKYKRRVLRAGDRDGHYYAALHNQPAKSGTMKRLVLTIDRVFPQHFCNYTLTAINDEGATDFHFQLARDPMMAALSPASCQLHNISTLLIFVIAALLLHG